MKFLQIDKLSINTDCITQIFIDTDTEPPYHYNIVIFYEGYGFNQLSKSRQICYYEKGIETYEKARRIFKHLLDELNKG